MNEYLSLFIESLKKSGLASDHTIVAYHTDLKKFVSYLNSVGVKRPEKVTDVRINAYLLSLKKEGKSDATIARTLVSVKKFFLFLDHTRVIEENPTVGIRPVYQTAKEPTIISKEQMNGFLNSVPNDTLKGKRDRAILELLYATGIKVSELIALRRDSLNLRIGYVSVVRNNRERVLPLTEASKEALKSYLAELGRYDLLTPILFVTRKQQPFTRQGIWKLVKEYGVAYGLPNDFSIQTMRNSFASHLLENGANAKSVQELLGIESTANLLRYVRKQDSETFKDYKNSHPRS